MTAVARARKAIEVRRAGNYQQAWGRMTCPIYGTHTVSYHIEPGKLTWVACSNPECPVTREQHAAHKVAQP